MNFSLSICFCFLVAVARAQPVSGTFRELMDSVSRSPKVSDSGEEIYVGFVSSNIRFEKGTPLPTADRQLSWQVTSWRGEKVHGQLVLWTQRLMNMNIQVKAEKNQSGNQIDPHHVKVGFVRYVMADGLNGSGGGCGIEAHHDSSLVADVIDHVSSLDVEPETVQPVWLSIDVPPSLQPGEYKLVLSVSDKFTMLQELSITVKVLNSILPRSSEWTYHLDLWQNPYAIAREHNVRPWSKEHLRIMRPYMQRLSAAGQKAITASIIHDPWNGQTQDIYQSMIRWIRKKDGTWIYDYAIFDQWVSYMRALGITKVINCYSLIPWNHRFYYFDEATGADVFIQAKPGTAAYEAHWRPMLTNFANHLKKKKWFGFTAIAMDERPLGDMQKAIELIKSVDPDFKISLAGNFHPEIEGFLFDYSVASNQDIDSATFSRRKKLGYTTTYYTCCTEGSPNTFTFSPPAESAWLAWYSANKKFDGYLRWAYNCWPLRALTDSRFSTWSSGDTFLVYPGNRTSVRFERMIEGIQDVEKIKILRDKFTRENRIDKLDALDSILKTFEIETLKTIPASAMVDQARQSLNDL